MSTGNFALTNDAAFEAGFLRTANELVELVLKKRRDYGSSVGYHGTRGLMPRIADKFFRLDALVWRSRTPNYESAEDTARDMAVYAIMLAIALEWERESAPRMHTVVPTTQQFTCALENHSACVHGEEPGGYRIGG